MKCKDCDKWNCLDRSYGEAECIHCDGQSFALQQQLHQSSKNIDWQSFRAEAAKDILCAVLSRIEIIDGDLLQLIENVIGNSIYIADKLIKKLKENEEK